MKKYLKKPNLRPNMFFVAMAAYLALIYLLVVTGTTYPILLGVLIGYLVLDRFVMQFMTVVLYRALIGLYTAVKRQGMDLTKDVQ